MLSYDPNAPEQFILDQKLTVIFIVYSCTRSYDIFLLKGGDVALISPQKADRALRDPVCSAHPAGGSRQCGKSAAFP